MQIDNHMSLKIAALSKNEAFARSVVAAFCASVNPTVDQLSDIKTAVSEAVTNAVVHAYEVDSGIIEINASLSGRTVHIEVLDEGVGIEDIVRAREPFFTTKPGDERSGMGFTVMESFMDTLEVKARDGGGLCVRMSKNFDMNGE
ncbi:MAG: anti-sigma F factor [Firmicutes bacterium]|nr:anti-sigma F factor [Bacillota bacterium]